MANYVKFRRGTSEAFKALGNRVEQDTLYFIYNNDKETADLYLGSKLISSGENDLSESSVIKLEDLTNVSIQKSVQTGDVLAYNQETGQWENRPFEFLLEDYAPTLTIETDNISIENVEGILQLKDFGVGYYSYIPAVKNEETGEIITPSTYKYIEGFKSGLEPRVITDENNNLCLAWYEPGTETVEDIAANIEDISKNLDNLNQVINAENGLSDQIKSLQTQTNQISTDLEVVKSDKADVNSVYTKDEIDESLENIYTKDEINNSFKSVYTKEETDTKIGEAIAAADHLKRVIVKNKTEIINDYFDKKDYDTYIFMVPTGFEAEADKYDEYIIIEMVDEEGISTKYLEKVGSWEVDLADYITKEEVGYVEGSRLVTEEEIQQFSQGEKNVINNVTADFTIVDGTLNLNGFLMTEDERDKLAKLPQKIYATDIQDLDVWLSQNGSTYITNIGVKNLDEELLNKLNNQGSPEINSDHFQIIDGALNLNSNILSTINTIGTNYVSKVDFNKAVGDLDVLLNKQDNLSTEIENIKTILTWQEIET